MRRKVTFFCVVTLVLSLLVIVCNLPAFAPASAQGQAGSGPSLQASGRQVHPSAAPVPVVDYLAGTASRRGTMEPASSSGWTVAPLAPGRKQDLRQAPLLGQLIQWGEYRSTDPSGTRSILGRAITAARGRSSILLLGAMMLLAIAMAAQRSEEAPRQEVTPSSVPCWRPEEPSRDRKHAPARSGPRVLVVSDQAAEWERVRLVPT